MTQESLPFSLREESASYALPAEQTEQPQPRSDAPTPSAAALAPSTNEITPATVLLAYVQELLSKQQADGLTVDDVATLLAVNKTQAKTWLMQLCDKGGVTKVKKSKPAKYRFGAQSGLLL